MQKTDYQDTVIRYVLSQGTEALLPQHLPDELLHIVSDCFAELLDLDDQDKEARNSLYADMIIPPRKERYTKDERRVCSKSNACIDGAGNWKT